ncbi:transcription initiation factor IIA subunit 2 [Echria macrotheca]|uniref:Transcription initiation factor IIA subunit 2 n=1 Tax=Echria macrotheca TaxID=438768 RepID=A0AAJ0BF26_9PEZI|nr:transcription initiation factor IIA subunit 2 [Echria macrotheca]
MSTANITSSTIYRFGSLGQTLLDTIDSLILAGRITPQLAIVVLEAYDRTMARGLGTRATMTLRGKLDMYRLCDNIWTFEVHNAKFSMNRGTVRGRDVIEAARVKIVAVPVGDSERS